MGAGKAGSADALPPARPVAAPPPPFPSAQVRSHAVTVLMGHEDEELMHYLLQLVQGLRCVWVGGGGREECGVCVLGGAGFGGGVGGPGRKDGNRGRNEGQGRAGEASASLQLCPEPSISHPSQPLQTPPPTPRYEPEDVSRLARFLIARGAANPVLATFLHWRAPACLASRLPLAPHAPSPLFRMLATAAAPRALF